MEVLSGKAKNEISPGRVKDLWNRIVLLDIDVLFFAYFQGLCIITSV